MLIIGSRAAGDRLGREPKDLDIILTPEEFTAWVAKHRPDLRSLGRCRPGKYQAKFGDRYGSTRVEIDLAESGTTNLVIWERNRTTAPHVCDILGDRYDICSPRDLLLLKQSHLYWPHNWLKTIRDWHILRTCVGGPIPDDDPTLVARLAETEARHGNPNRARSLDVPNEEFFGGSDKLVRRSYEHDDLHAATCYYNRPLYERCKPDLSKAYVSGKMFRNLSHQDQLRMVREECYAIALERKVIPALPPGDLLLVVATDAATDRVHVVEAYQHALARICTTLTKGWFRDFAIEHFPDLEEPEKNYVNDFITALAAGRVREQV